MKFPCLNLIVVRVADLERAAAFYRALGLEFVRHAHGNGPEHYASQRDGMVFELYPATAGKPPSNGLRIGFTVADLDSTAAWLGQVDGACIVSPPKPSEWGRRAVIADPDGNRIELIEQISPLPERLARNE